MTPPDAPRRSRFAGAPRVLLIVAVSISALAVVLVIAAWRNDIVISSDKGTATADVLSAGQWRSAVSFVTPDGETRNPELGVLYPTNLVSGQRIDVEYARSDPDLVRVAGRNASVAVIPALSVIVVTWVVTGPIVWWLVRRREPGPDVQEPVAES